MLIALYKTSQFLDFAQRLKHFGSSSVFLLSEVDLRLLFAVFLPLGVVAMMALARLVDAAGIGAGYSILVATRAAFRFARQGFYAVQQVPTELLLRFLLPLGILAVVGRCCRGRRMPAAYPMFETAIAPSSL